MSRIDSYTKYRCLNCGKINWTFDYELEKYDFIGFRCWNCKAETVDSDIDPRDLEWAKDNDEYEFQQGHDDPEYEKGMKSLKSDRAWRVSSWRGQNRVEKIITGDREMLDWVRENLDALEMNLTGIPTNKEEKENPHG